MLRVATAVTAIVLAAGAAFAHHGWGSYDAAKPVTVAGPIVTSKYENPHATVTVRGEGKVWTVTLAPTSRMSTRGASEKVIAAFWIVLGQTTRSVAKSASRNRCLHARCIGKARRPRRSAQPSFKDNGRLWRLQLNDCDVGSTT